jgi:hypothetical protein
VKIDDMLVKDRRPGHPVRLSQAELVCLAVAQALLGFHSEHRWIRCAVCHLRVIYPYMPFPLVSCLRWHCPLRAVAAPAGGFCSG